MPGLKERLARIATFFAGRDDLGFTTAEELEALLLNELGALDILGGWCRSGGSFARAVPPRKIYHVLASNLAISAETSLVLGLILGSELVFKLPGAGLPDFEATVEKLPGDFKAKVKLGRILDEAEMSSADAVVVYGSNETVDMFRSKVRREQRGLYYGHRISLGIVEAGVGNWEHWAEKAAEEIVAYDQQGCLSPQFYLASREDEALIFAELLAKALRKKCLPAPEESPAFEDLAQRRHARRMLRGRGEKVWECDEGHGYTVALLSRPDFSVGPGYRFVQVGYSNHPGEALRGWRGQISCISLGTPVWPPVSECWDRLAQELGASRLCQMGNLQKPPLSWKHDGRPRLGDLVFWITRDV